MIARVLCLSLGFFTMGGAFEPSRAPAAEPKADVKLKTETVLTIDGMHCAGCAKKVSRKLEAIKPVASAKVDAATGKAIVAPTKGKKVSPKLLWEAVEAAGYKPTKLQGPSGTFTKKPKS